MISALSWAIITYNKNSDKPHKNFKNNYMNI